MIKNYDPIYDERWLCSFGITEAIGGILAGVGAAGAAAAPEAAAAIAPAAAGAIAPAAADIAAITLPDVAVTAAAPAAATAAGAAAPALAAGGAGALTAADLAAGAAAPTPTPAPSGLDQALAATTPLIAPTPTPGIAAPTVPSVAPPVAQPAGLSQAIAPVSGTPGPGAGAAGISPPPAAPVSPTATGTIGAPPTDTNLFTLTTDQPGTGSAAVGGTPPGGGGASFTIPGTDTTVTGAPLAQSPEAALNETAAQQAASGAGPTQSSLDKFIASPSLGGLGDVVSANSWILPAAGLGYQFLNQPKLPDPTKLTSNIENTAGQLNAQGQQLQGYLPSGTLPPGVQSGITQASDAAKAAVRSQYASRGASGSSAEFEDLQAIDNRAATEGANLAFNLLQQGVSETGLSAQLYQYLLQSTLAQDQQLGNAIGNFSGALAGLSRGAQPSTTTQQPTAA